MELLKFFKQPLVDNRKQQETKDWESSTWDQMSSYLDQPSVGYTNTSSNITARAPQAQDDYTRMYNLFHDKSRFSRAAQTYGNKKRLGTREASLLAAGYGITDPGAIKLMRNLYNSRDNDLKYRAYMTQFADDYLRPLQQQRARKAQAQTAAQRAAAATQKQKVAAWAAQQYWNDKTKDSYWNPGEDWTNTAALKTGGTQGVVNFQKSIGMDVAAQDGKFGQHTFNAAQTFRNELVNRKAWDEVYRFDRDYNSMLGTTGFKTYGVDNTKLGGDVTNANKIEYLKSQQNLQKNPFNPYSEDYNTQYTQAQTQQSLDDQKYAWSNNLTLNRQGGRMNLKYFQSGGAMTVQAAPAQASEQDMQAQVVQLVQAAMQGDEKASEAVKQIMQAAQQGDEQAMQIAQLIQDIVKQMQGQAQAAKRGAKLSYIHTLKTGCPSGYEVSYHSKGGPLCKECVRKHAKGDVLTEEDKKMKRGTKAQVDSIATKLLKRYPNLTRAQVTGAEPIRKFDPRTKSMKTYYMNGDGELIEASKLAPKNFFGGEISHKFAEGGLIPIHQSTSYSAQRAVKGTGTQGTINLNKSRNTPQHEFVGTAPYPPIARQNIAQYGEPYPTNGAKVTTRAKQLLGNVFAMNRVPYNYIKNWWNSTDRQDLNKVARDSRNKNSWDLGERFLGLKRGGVLLGR